MTASPDHRAKGGETGRPRIGFIGPGHMGRPMAERLLNDGWPLTVLDSRADAMGPLVDAGARASASPATLAAESEIVLLALPTPETVEAVLLGPDGVASSGGAEVVIDFSTTGPVAEVRLAEALASSGRGLVDCPVSGGPAGARAGTLALIAAAEPALIERLRPVLAPLGRLFVAGARPGMAQTLKLVNNMDTSKNLFFSH